MSMFDTVVIGTVLLAAISLIVVQLRTGVPAMPSSRAERNAATILLARAGLARNARVYELGCGWGGFAVALAKALPDQRIIGVELSPLPYLVSRLRALWVPNLSVRWGNFLALDLSAADAVACYLMIAPMPTLAAKLDRELRPGTLVCTVMFWFRDRTPVLTTQLPGTAVALYEWRQS